MISRHHLITNKKTAARLQDLADAQQLEAAKDRLASTRITELEW